ncbi:hypothetical protein LguiA_001943 [Lonicera macranthoides]
MRQRISYNSGHDSVYSKERGNLEDPGTHHHFNSEEQQAAFESDNRVLEERKKLKKER